MRILKKKFLRLLIILIGIATLCVLKIFVSYPATSDYHETIWSPNHSTSVSRLNKSLWLEYRNNWNGEVLIKMDKNKIITFTPEYRIQMIDKGLHPLAYIHNRFADRIKRLREYCNEFPLSHNGSYNPVKGLYQVTFNDTLEVIQCLVQKVSSSSWVHIFIHLAGTNQKDYPQPLSMSPLWKEISLGDHLNNLTMLAKRYQTYTKFLITRNPFERILSAYVSKFQSDDEKYESYFAPIIISANYLSTFTYFTIYKMKLKAKIQEKQLRDEVGDNTVNQIQRLSAGVGKYKITFLEFITYVIKVAQAGGRLDSHWAPITEICNPCSIQYDILAKFETLNEDSQAILDYILTRDPTQSIKFPEGKPSTTNERCNEAFRSIPLKMRNSLHQIYKEDYMLFGYEFKGSNKKGDLC